ncbi:4'-phosphopantetheinyl transferase family protein [Salinibius halmophilus]|uniref:4'-phosphopantetheinyl transferase family protein n=1 Tax=Salinibius halmophilus TaxID=1853216 RepID=UPI000E65F7B0|nr:4'-phosphopantetheinyl transferase superfamily protein [Salinibius halmophilus]
MVAFNHAYIHIARAQQITAAQQQWLLSVWPDYDAKRYCSLSRESVKQQFLISRYWMYHWLIQHWQLEDVRMTRNDHGKPFLLASPLFISLSHTKEWVVLAVSNHEIGIDIERIDRMKTKHLRWFSQAEQQAFRQGLVSLSELWTLKEAIVKQKGSTLARELARCDINWHSWRDSHDLYSQTWHNDWQLSACAPEVNQWHVQAELG